jgi:hypothetical protein
MFISFLRKKSRVEMIVLPIKKWGTELNKELSTEEYRMVGKHLKKYSKSLIIREMQIKTP